MVFPMFWLFTSKDPSDRIIDELATAAKRGYLDWVAVQLPTQALLQLERGGVRVDLGETARDR